MIKITNLLAQQTGARSKTSLSENGGALFAALGVAGRRAHRGLADVQGILGDTQFVKQYKLKLCKRTQSQRRVTR